jgi:hypothetical protein
MINLLQLQASEAERIAYWEGFTGTAELFKRIVDLEDKVNQLENDLQESFNREKELQDEICRLDSALAELEANQ